MSRGDKLCYYGGLVGLIGFPIAMVVDMVITGPQIYHLKGITGIIASSYFFYQGRKARQAARAGKAN